jgi:hypothetical protein
MVKPIWGSAMLRRSTFLRCEDVFTAKNGMLHHTKAMLARRLQ